ncbi:MAG TPA: aldolase/citrate lyase family protein [Devosiaceae bacterium]|nr:aldolase/citrate lyase family protein [Devosiaceae bacterium]
MPSPNPLKTALARNERQLGLWLSLASATATELAARAGFDWVLIDMEHTTLGESEALAHLRAARGGTAETVVRVPWNDAVIIKRMLDAGARSIIVPQVQNAEEARRAVAATRYPPDGIRGFSGITRANDYGRTKDYPTTAANEIFLTVQVESPEAVRNAAEIAAVEGVDGVFVGPNDLAANMGLVGQAGHPSVREAIASVIAPVRAAGKAPGVLDFNIASSKSWFDMGFSWIAVGSDLSLLRAGVDALLASYRA